jgi:two-component system OmpR family response regulator/two-component system response regulator RstA
VAEEDSVETGDNDELVFGQFSISQGTRAAYLSGEEMELTTAEFDLLWLLASHAGQVVARRHHERIARHRF